MLVLYLFWQGERFIELDLANAQWRLLIYCLENPHLNNMISIYARLDGTAVFIIEDFAAVRQAIIHGRIYKLILE